MKHSVKHFRSRVCRYPRLGAIAPTLTEHESPQMNAREQMLEAIRADDNASILRIYEGNQGWQRHFQTIAPDFLARVMAIKAAQVRDLLAAADQRKARAAEDARQDEENRTIISRTGRKQLEARAGQRFPVTARVARFGSKRGWKGRSDESALFADVRDENGVLLSDHLWFTVGKTLQHVRPGDRVRFMARAEYYVAGYFGHRDNVHSQPHRCIGLARPTKLEIIRPDSASA